MHAGTLFAGIFMGKHGYDRALPYTSVSRSKTKTSHRSRRKTKTSTVSDTSGVTSGLSGIGTEVSGGCETVVTSGRGHGHDRRPWAATSNKSKVNVLVTILAVIFTQFLFCVIFAVLVLLHHARIVDWIPALLDMTGEGYLREISEGELKQMDIDYENLE
ncbi:hypothetical protein GCK32_010830 [Trichostrongylus colubriformis]|uniref:Uncharacterized protein n=1 Tax=Trichostrongylus colubriformis TaxID=6319 RepID=A0AAN8FHZ3_TRICO